MTGFKQDATSAWESLFSAKEHEPALKSLFEVSLFESLFTAKEHEPALKGPFWATYNTEPALTGVARASRAGTRKKEKRKHKQNTTECGIHTCGKTLLTCLFTYHLFIFYHLLLAATLTPGKQGISNTRQVISDRY